MPTDACKWRCSECGHGTMQRFPDDICPMCGTTLWRCVACSFVLVASSPPLLCPACSEDSRFENITGYIPEWSE